MVLTGEPRRNRGAMGGKIQGPGVAGCSRVKGEGGEQRQKRLQVGQAWRERVKGAGDAPCSPWNQKRSRVHSGLSNIHLGILPDSSASVSLSLSEIPGATPTFLPPQRPGSAAAAGCLGLERRAARIKGSGERV